MTRARARLINVLVESRALVTVDQPLGLVVQRAGHHRMVRDVEHADQAVRRIHSSIVAVEGSRFVATARISAVSASSALRLPTAPRVSSP